MSHDIDRSPLAVLVALALAIALPALGIADSAKTPMKLSDPPAPGQLIQPADLERVLADTTAQRPVVLQVGVKNFFKNGHIPGSRYFGPAGEPEGLASLKKLC